MQGLTSLKGDTLDGMAPPLTFKAGQPHPVDCWFEALMKDGKASLPIGTQTVCEKSRDSPSGRRPGSASCRPLVALTSGSLDDSQG